MPIGKWKDIWTVIRTVLKENPGIKAEFFIQKVQEKTGRSRSTIYEHLSSLELRGKIHREKGHYFLGKPTQKGLKPSSTGESSFWNVIDNFFKRRKDEKRQRLQEIRRAKYMKYLLLLGPHIRCEQKQLSEPYWSEGCKSRMEERLIKLQDLLEYKRAYADQYKNPNTSNNV